MAVRNGFIPICVGGATEGDRSQVLVDSTEVYAEGRGKLSHLFPITERQGLPIPNRQPFLHEKNVGTNPNLLGASIRSSFFLMLTNC